MSYRKSTWEKLWELVPKELEGTIANRFRTITDVNQFIFVFYALLEGEFYPTNMDRQGHYFNILKESDIATACEAILNHKYKRLCVNDNCSQETFVIAAKKIGECLEKILPEKCAFEKNEVEQTVGVTNVTGL